MSRPLVVTRHPALLELLLERGLLRAPYDHLTHAAAADVRGRDVIGVLPIHLAAEATSITEIPLTLPAALRGVELDLPTLRACAGEAVRYYVVRASDVSVGDLDAVLTSRRCGWARRPPAAD